MKRITLICQYNDMIGARYPFLEIEILIQQTKELYILIEPSSRTESTSPLAIGMDVPSIHILRMLLVVVLACEGASCKALTDRLFKSLQKTVQEKQLGYVANTKDLALLILAVRINQSTMSRSFLILTTEKPFYYFYTNRLQMAARLGSIMVRRAFELGLHRRSTVLRPNSERHNLVNAVNAFWTIYVLDRQWSFAVGLPQSLQDADIDPDLPEPVSQYSYSSERFVHFPYDYNTKGWESDDNCMHRIAPHF